MFKLISKAYTAYKTYRTVKKVIKDVDIMSNEVKTPSNSSNFLEQRAREIISNLKNKYKIDIPDDILMKLIDVGVILCRGEKASVEKRDLTYMIVVYLIGEVKDIYYYIEKYFKNKKR